MRIALLLKPLLIAMFVVSLFSLSFSYPSAHAVTGLATSAPAGPSHVVATAGACGSNAITVSWDADPAALSYYVLKSQTDGGPYSWLTAISASSPSYTDIAITPGTNYYYVIQTYSNLNGGTQSSPSAQASATAPAACPNQPPPPPVVTLTANPLAITSLGATTLSFSQAGSTSPCTGGPAGLISAGVLTVYPTQTTTYTVTCSNTGGTTTKSVTISVTQITVPKVTSLTPTSVTTGGTVTITGANFNQSSRINSNEISGGPNNIIPTSYTATTLTFTLPANYVPGTYHMHVFDSEAYTISSEDIPLVVVSPPAQPTSVTVSAPISAVDIGTYDQLVAVVLDQTAHPIPAQTFVWASSNPSIATVDSAGLVTGVSVGAATITATSSGKSGTTTINVQAAAPVQATPAPTTLPPTTGATVTAGACDTHSILVNWIAVPNTTSYDVYRKASSNQFTLLTTVAQTTYVDTNTTPLLTYFYTITPTNTTPQYSQNASAVGPDACPIAPVPVVAQQAVAQKVPVPAAPVVAPQAVNNAPTTQNEQPVQQDETTQPANPSIATKIATWVSNLFTSTPTDATNDTNQTVPSKQDSAPTEKPGILDSILGWFGWGSNPSTTQSTTPSSTQTTTTPSPTPSLDSAPTGNTPDAPETACGKANTPCCTTGEKCFGTMYCGTDDICVDSTCGTLNQACCTGTEKPCKGGGTCNPNSGLCTIEVGGCGTVGTKCCSDNTCPTYNAICDQGSKICKHCGGAGEACCDGFSPHECDVGTCENSVCTKPAQHCGRVNEPCCPPGDPSGEGCHGITIYCGYHSNICVSDYSDNPDYPPGQVPKCGMIGKNCCPGHGGPDFCYAPSSMCSAGSCTSCGKEGQPCCDKDACSVGSCSSSGICQVTSNTPPPDKKDDNLNDGTKQSEGGDCYVMSDSGDFCSGDIVPEGSGIDTTYNCCPSGGQADT